MVNSGVQLLRHHDLLPGRVPRVHGLHQGLALPPAGGRRGGRPPPGAQGLAGGLPQPPLARRARALDQAAGGAAAGADPPLPGGDYVPADLLRSARVLRRLPPHPLRHPPRGDGVARAQAGPSELAPWEGLHPVRGGVPGGDGARECPQLRLGWGSIIKVIMYDWQ
eukprot:1195675-Prorocentrum_minimum.AAC.6